MTKFILFFLLIFTFLGNAHQSEKKRIFVLHSYSQEYGWTKSQNDAFVADLQKSFTAPLEFSIEYLDTKRHPFTEEYQQFFLSYLQKKFEEYRPDAIYVTDDNALELFIKHRDRLFPGIPIFFSGINNLSLSNTLEKDRYTGVYESKDVVPNIELIRQFSPQTRDIWFVGDDSTTYKSIERDIHNQIKNYPHYTFHFLSSPYIGDIISRLPTTPKSFVLLTTIGGFSDSSGRSLTLKESISLLGKNSHIILCSTEDAYVMGNVVGGFVTSGYQQGRSASELLKRYLYGEPLGHIHAILKSPNVYMFDRKALITSRLILSEYTARNAIIINDGKTFFEKYQQIILNFMFIGLILFLLFIVAIYFIIAQKKGQIVTLIEELNTCASEVVHLKSALFDKNVNNE